MASPISIAWCCNWLPRDFLGSRTHVLRYTHHYHNRYHHHPSHGHPSHKHHYHTPYHHHAYHSYLAPRRSRTRSPSNSTVRTNLTRVPSQLRAQPRVDKRVRVVVTDVTDPEAAKQQLQLFGLLVAHLFAACRLSGGVSAKCFSLQQAGACRPRGSFVCRWTDALRSLQQPRRCRFLYLFV